MRTTYQKISKFKRDHYEAILFAEMIAAYAVISAALIVGAKVTADKQKAAFNKQIEAAKAKEILRDLAEAGMQKSS